ncbi:uncharacterized protein [Anabrus simplex]|uniref:uncharacterized protein n=1 Tax=Anabrus simplex TaxID=316456 RepID=UPI0034DDA87B
MAALPATFVPGFHDEAAVRRMRYNSLGKTGLQVSHLAFGGGALGNHYGSYSEEEAIAAVRQAIKQGVNYIDTAPWYGQGRSEEVLGKALQGVPRQAYYIGTKVARYDIEVSKMFDFSAEKTKWSIDHSLKLLGLDYVDVIQVHDIEFAPSLDMVLNETLPELEKAVQDGKARFIGVTGYPVSELKKAVEGSRIPISTILSYSRDTLIDSTLQEYIPFFQSKGVGVIEAAGPAMGLLTNGGPPDWHPASNELKEICAAAANFCKEQNVELGRLAMYHTLAQKGPAMHLVGMNNRELVRSNLDILQNGINDLEKQTLQEVKTRFFSKVSQGHWEGREIQEYWKKMETLQK